MRFDRQERWEQGKRGKCIRAEAVKFVVVDTYRATDQLNLLIVTYRKTDRAHLMTRT